MGRKYKRRKRILGISAMILAFLIAIYPSFSYAATYDSRDEGSRITVTDSRSEEWGDPYVIADLHNDDQHFVIISDGEDSYAIAKYLYGYDQSISMDNVVSLFSVENTIGSNPDDSGTLYTYVESDRDLGSAVSFYYLGSPLGENSPVKISGSAKPSNAALPVSPDVAVRMTISRVTPFFPADVTIR